MSLISLLTFFAGLLLGNRLAIGRDKRKEFNEIAFPLYKKISDYLADEQHNKLPTIDELKEIVHYLPVWKKTGYMTLLDNLKKDLAKDSDAIKYDPVLEEVTIQNGYVSKTATSAASLIKYLKRQ